MKDNTIYRQVDLDWIRVMATYVVFIYHISMFFNPFPWHIKNDDINESYILVFTLLTGTWIMPIFFAISGITTLHALGRRSSKEFIRERLMRLGIPLVFGVFVLTPPQVFIERLTHQQFEGSFIDFFPHYFDGLYLEINGTGNFAFVGLHLWYLLVLLIFSLLLLPVLKKVSVSNSFNNFHYLLLPLVLFIVAAFFEVVNLGGWGLPYYLVIFILGYIYFSQNTFKNFIRKNAKMISVITFITSFLYIYLYMDGILEKGLLASLIFISIKVMNSWNWLLLIFFLGDKFLATPKKGLNYLSKASMPFYVLHQPIIVGIGFYLYKLSWNSASKLLFLTVISFIVIMLIYHFIIQHIPIIRIVFGLKGKSKKIKKDTSISGFTN
jgi:glucans biosynthesis protein C